MALPPYEAVPTVQPVAGPPNNELRIPSSPAEFGGLIAQGGKELGQGAEKLGSFYGEVAADDAYNQYQERAHKILFGTGQPDPVTGEIDNGYYGLKGRKALEARGGVEQQLEQLRNEVRGNLASPQQQLLFDQNSRRLQAYTSQEMARFGIQQGQAWTTEVNNSTYQNQLTSVAARPEDDLFAQEALVKAFQAKLREQQNSGGDTTPDVVESIKTQVARDVATARIRALTTVNPARAQQLFDADRDLLSGGRDFDQIANLVDRGLTATYESQANSGDLLGAWNRYQQNKGRYSPEAQAHLDAFFQPKIRDAQARDTGFGVTGDWARKYYQDQGVLPQAPSGEKPFSNIAATDALPIIMQNESGGRNVYSDIEVPGYTREQRGSGLYQIIPSTWREGKQLAGVDANLYPHAIDAPAEVQTKVATALYNKYGAQPWMGNPKTVAALAALGGAPIAPTTTGQLAPANATELPQGGNAASPPIRQTLADYYNTHYADIVNDARDRATRDHPEDPHYVDSVVARTEQQLNQVITQQRRAYEADNKLIIQAFNGDFSKGARPTTMDQLRAASPEVSAALDRLMISNPLAMRDLETRVLTAASKGDRASTEYGDAFWDVYRQIHPPDGSAPTFTDPAKLYNLVGPGDGPRLTLQGFDRLAAEMYGKKDADPTAQAMKSAAIEDAKKQLSNALDLGAGMKVPDPRGDHIFASQFLPAFLQAYDQGIAAGKTPFSMLTEGSKDYIVGPLIQRFKRPAADQTADKINAVPDPTADSSRDDIRSWYLAHPSPENWDKARDLLIRKGVLAAPGPQAPQAR